VPLAEAVVFAMLASYVLSRTLVPTMALYLMKGTGGHEGDRPVGSVCPGRLQRACQLAPLRQEDEGGDVHERCEEP